MNGSIARVFALTANIFETAGTIARVFAREFAQAQRRVDAVDGWNRAQADITCHDAEFDRVHGQAA